MNININLNFKNTYVETINVPGYDDEILTIVHTLDKSGFDSIVMGGIEVIYERSTDTIYGDAEFKGSMDEFEAWYYQVLEEISDEYMKYDLPPMGDLLQITMRALRAAYNECQS